MEGEGLHYRYKKYEFWADRGLVTLLDTELAGDSTKREEEYTWRIPPGEFMKRAISALMADPDKYASERTQLKKLLDDAKTVCKEAKRYGDPTDPNVLNHVIKHQRKRSIVLPGELPPMPGQRFKLDIEGKSTGDILTKGVDVIPDLTIVASNMLTPQRAELRRAANRR